MTTSEQINEIAAACAKAQAELKPADKSAKNEAFKRDGKATKYADLAAIIEAVRAYAKCDVAIFQSTSSDLDGAVVVTRLVHKSGQWIQSDPLKVPVSKRDAHGLGSAITYAKRYQLQGMTLVAADEDDDGNAAAQTTQAKPVAAVPAGFQDWLDDLASAADSGTDALKTAWTKSKTDYRNYLTSTNNEMWETLKARASKVKVSA
jgi:hypothetical protein